jgi:AraC family transcriptional regulator
MRTNANERWAAASARADTAVAKWLPAWPAANADAEAQLAGGEAQQLRIDITPVEQVLRTTRNVALGRYRCPPDHPQFALGGGPHTCSYIAFHRTSVRMKIADWRPEVATPNHVSFYNVGEMYTREAIGSEGDECDWLALSPRLLRDAHAELAEAEAAGGRLFPRPFAPMKPETFLAQRQLFAAAANAQMPLNSLQLEEAVTGLVDAVLGQALDFWGGSRSGRRRPRPLCHRRRLQIVEDAKALLAREYWSDMSLADLARQLHCSAAHLSRLFHATTGYRLCEYRQELRLRKGMFLLEETGLEIGDIAVQVGFASHSHFTSAFHRRFGLNPSAFLKRKAYKVIRAMATC